MSRPVMGKNRSRERLGGDVIGMCVNILFIIRRNSESISRDVDGLLILSRGTWIITLRSCARPGKRYPIQRVIAKVSVC